MFMKSSFAVFNQHVRNINTEILIKNLWKIKGMYMLIKVQHDKRMLNLKAKNLVRL